MLKTAIHQIETNEHRGKSILLLLLMERVGERRIKSITYIPLILAFSLKGEGAGNCVDPFTPRVGGR